MTQDNNELGGTVEEEIWHLFDADDTVADE
mgnify:CR=1 FL=1